MEQTQEQTHVDVQTAPPEPVIQTTPFLRAVYALWIFIYQLKEADQKYQHNVWSSDLYNVWLRLTDAIAALGVPFEEVYILEYFAYNKMFDEFRTCIKNNTTRQFIVRHFGDQINPRHVDFMDLAFNRLMKCYSSSSNKVYLAYLAPPEEDYAEIIDRSVQTASWAASFCGDRS